MSKTKKLSGSKTTSRLLEDSPVHCIEVLSELSLEKYCSKKSFEIEIVVPLSSESQNVLNQIVATGKEYEEYSGVQFVTYDDVLHLLERLSRTDDETKLPQSIKECAQKVISTEVQDVNSLSIEFLAIATKLKVLELMYGMYSSEVGSMQRRHKIRDELGELVKNCDEKNDKSAKKTGKKGKSEHKKKKSKGSDKETKLKKSQSSTKREKSKTQIKTIEDYTEILLDENETVFDYNVDNHFTYIILSGFPDPLLLKELIKIHVEVSAVIDVGLNSQIEKTDDIILKLQEMFETPQHSNYLENTIWMKYRTDGSSSPKQTLEEFLYVVKKINNIKRQHLSYIKDLFLYTLGPTPKKLKASCLEKYTRILNGFPSELINIALIVNALVEEICWRESGQIYSLSDLTSSSSGSEITAETNVQPYRAHEEDLLLMGMKSYKESGRKYYEQSLNYLRLLPVLKKVNPDLGIRFKNRAVSTEDHCFCDHTKELYDWFHLAVFSQMRGRQFVPKLPQDYGFGRNLVAYDQSKRYQEIQPRGLPTSHPESSNIINDYHLKEDLSTSVLFQMIFQTLKDYSAWDRFFCEESGATLLRFHDNLNQFGIDTKMWDQSLRTPVCLRDFCRFVTNEEEEWMEQNQVKTPTTKETECHNTHTEIYQEYQYLLGPIPDGSEKDKREEFDRVISELLNYPKSTYLANYCQESATLLAYDLGPQVCKLTGHTTIFHSDDGVKVTIDTTRFMTEEPKCTIAIDTDGNSVIFHKNRPSAFHFNLKDGTIVSFTEIEKSVDEILPSHASHEENDPEETQEVEEVDTTDLNYKDYWFQILRQSKVAATIPNLGDISEKKRQLDDKNLIKILELFRAAVYKERPIYKISLKPSPCYLKRTTSPVLVPLVNCLKKILFKPAKKKRKIGGYSVFNFPKLKKQVPSRYDFKITVPNGLLITTLSRTKRLAEIRQEYKYNAKKEKYRIFYASGIVFVKHVDGTMTIYRSNGDIIRLSDGSHHCDGDCAEYMKYAFEDQEKKTQRTQASRCVDSYEMKIGSGLMRLYEFGDIPYSKKTLLDVDGKKTEIHKDKVTEKQAYYVTSEHDYRNEEIFYEREDGMKSIVDKKGTQVFQFPDGTKITTTPVFEKELIFVGSKLASEGWVSVMVNYKFEHPDYVTVEYDNISESTHIFLRDATIKTVQESFVMSTHNNIGLEVISDRITVLKTCGLCESDCVCSIYIDDNLKFFEMLDSYRKHLVCDSFGDCEMVSKFITKSENENNCNHKWTNEKQKLFVLNERGPPGTILWPDSLIESKMAEFKNDRNSQVLNYINKLDNKQTLEFMTEVRQDFTERFTMPLTDQFDICLSKNKYVDGGDKSRLFCITLRVLVDFRDLDQQSEIIGELQEFLDNHFVDGTSNHLLDSVAHMLKYISNNYIQHYDQSILSYRLGVRELEDSAGSNSSSTDTKDAAKILVQDVIAKWRNTCEEYKDMIKNKKFLCYFRSQAYRDILVMRGLDPV